MLLILTLMLCQAIELTFLGANSIVASKHGLAALVNDNTTLLLLRVVLFGMFPLVLATHMVRKSDADLDRDTLKAPFYAQCYAAAPFALILSIGATLSQFSHPVSQLAGLGLFAISFLFYGLLQVRWFARKLQCGAFLATFHASLGMVESIAFAAIVAVLFAL